MTTTPPRSAVVVLAGGSGSRLGATRNGQAVNKAYLELHGRPLMLWSLHAAAKAPGVQRLVLIVREQDRTSALALVAAEPPELPVEVVTGGATRYASEAAGIAHLNTAIADGSIEVIAVHDAARPLAGTPLFSQVLQVAAEYGGAIPGVSAGPLLPAGYSMTDGPDPAAHDSGHSPSQHDDCLVRVQTPQAFRAQSLQAAFAQAAAEGFEGTDTSSCVERYATAEVVVVPGSVTNLKVTYPDDVAVASALLAQTASA